MSFQLLQFLNLDPAESGVCTGYGDSPVAQEFPDSESRSEFLLKLLSVLNIKQPVIVSPSMSAFYVLPFVTEHTEHVRTSASAPFRRAESTESCSHRRRLTHGTRLTSPRPQRYFSLFSSSVSNCLD
jgi:hypothetical protein